MKVFIENEAGSNQKHIFDEKQLAYKKTVTVSTPYPYPYGFVLNTTSGDGDNLDCFVLTKQSLASQAVVEAEIVGAIELVEDGQEDPKILAVLAGEPMAVDGQVEVTLREFLLGVFAHLPAKKMVVGKMLSKELAEDLVLQYKD